MALLYGPQVTEQQLDAALFPFYERRDSHRRRFQEDGIAISYNEAVDAYRFVAPLLSEPAPEYAEQRAILNAITFPCSETGGFGFRVPAVRAILEGFERQISEESTTLNFQHEGEAAAREVSAWDRFVAYRALEFFVNTPLSDEWRNCVERATSILEKRTVNRPPGQFDPRLNAIRDSFVVVFLHELQGCGLPVTSLKGGCLAAAMDEATGISETRICDVWRDAELLRPDRQRRHRRCAVCGEPAGEDACRDNHGDLICRACARARGDFNP